MTSTTSSITVTVVQIPFTPAPDTPPATPQDVPITFAPLSNDGGSSPKLVAVGSTNWVRSTVVLNDDTIPAVVANDDPGLTAVVNQMKTLDVLANDTPTAVGPALAIKAGSVTGFTHGGSAVIAGNKINYTPTLAGNESFTYIATNTITEDGATVGVIVSAAPSSVIANPDTNPGFTATLGVTRSLDVLANDTPMPGLLINSVTQGTHGGTVAINVNQDRVRYTGTLSGPDTFTYTAKDASIPPRISAPATVGVLVSGTAAPILGVPDGPGGAFAAMRGVQTLLPVLANDTPQGPNLKIKAGSITAISNGGTVTINTDAPGNQVVYKSTNTFVGNETFRYVATDGVTESAATLVTVTVTAPAPGGPFSTPFTTIGLTRTAASGKLVRPTTQLRNIQRNNADADYGVGSWKNILSGVTDNATLDLRDRKFYHHSLVNPQSDITPGRKSVIRPPIRNGLCIYGAELIGEQLPVGSSQYNDANYFSMKNKTLRTGGTNTKTMDDDGIKFETAVRNAEVLVEHCIFRGQFDGISCNGNGTDTDQLVRVRECYAEEQVDEFLEIDSLQRLTVEGVLVDSCGHFLSMRPGSGNITPIPDYSVAANRVKLRQCLVRLRGTFYTSNNGPNPYGDAFDPYAKRDKRWDINNPTAAFNWKPGANDFPGFTHGQWFKGNGDNQLNFTPYVVPAGGWDPNNSAHQALYKTMTTIYLDCEDCIFAFENQRNTGPSLFLPPGTYKNTYVCFLPNCAVGDSNPGRSDFVDAALITNRPGVTVYWGSEARTFWLDNRAAWITARGGFTNTAGSLDFPFAHVP